MHAFYCGFYSTTGDSACLGGGVLMILMHFWCVSDGDMFDSVVILHAFDSGFYCDMFDSDSILLVLGGAMLMILMHFGCDFIGHMVDSVCFWL